ncbi:unnamed protein product [Boreogadus saida]
MLLFCGARWLQGSAEDSQWTQHLEEIKDNVFWNGLVFGLRSLFLLKLGSFQFAVLKIAFTVLSIVLYTNDNFNLTDLEITGAAIWINPLVGVLTIIALWPVAIMFMHLRVTLRSIKIIPKYAMYQLVLVLSQLQSAIINILAMNGTIACAPPYSSTARGYLMSQQLLILEMFIITLVNRLLYRRHYEPLSEEEEEDKQTRTPN